MKKTANQKIEPDKLARSLLDSVTLDDLTFQGRAVKSVEQLGSAIRIRLYGGASFFLKVEVERRGALDETSASFKKTPAADEVEKALKVPKKKAAEIARLMSGVNDESIWEDEIEDYAPPSHADGFRHSVFSRIEHNLHAVMAAISALMKGGEVEEIVVQDCPYWWSQDVAGLAIARTAPGMTTVIFDAVEQTFVLKAADEFQDEVTDAVEETREDEEE